MSQLFRRFRAWLARAIEAILPIGRTGIPPLELTPAYARALEVGFPADDAATEPMDRVPEIDIDVTVFEAAPPSLVNVPNPAFRAGPSSDFGDFEEVTKPGADLHGTRVGGWVPQRPVMPAPRRVADA